MGILPLADLIISQTKDTVKSYKRGYRKGYEEGLAAGRSERLGDKDDAKKSKPD